MGREFWDKKWYVQGAPRADLLMQMPHPEEDKVVKYPTKLMPGGGGGGGGRIRTVGIDRAINAVAICPAAGYGLK